MKNLKQHIRVLMLGWEFPPHLSGGLGVASQGLVEALASQVDLDLILPDWETIKATHKLVTERADSPINPYPIGISPYASEDQHYGAHLRENIKDYTQHTLEVAAEKEYDVIHAHDWMTFGPAMELKARSGKPMVLHVHALETDRNKGGDKNWVYELEQKALQEADLILPVSEYTAEVIRSEYGISEEKIKPIHNGLKPFEAYQTDRPFPEKLVVYVGRLAHQKGPDLFVDMAIELLKKQPELRFALAGDGPMEFELMTQVADLRLGDRIHFLGFMQREEVFDLLSMADVYVMPSRSEPFGLAALEAAYFGVPSVISHHAGVKEVLHPAVYVDPEQTNDLVATVASILAAPERAASMGQQLKKSSQGLDWEQAAKHVLEAYQELV